MERKEVAGSATSPATDFGLLFKALFPKVAVALKYLYKLLF
jgi:hypothetical protein